MRTLFSFAILCLILAMAVSHEEVKSSSSSSSCSSSSEESSDTKYGYGSLESRIKVVEYKHQICFSRKPMPICRLGYYAVDYVDKTIGFHCMRAGHSANRLKEEAFKGENISAFRKKHVTNHFKVNIPTKCD